MEKTIEINVPKSFLSEHHDEVLQLSIHLVAQGRDEVSEPRDNDYLSLAHSFLNRKPFSENYRRSILSLLRTLVRYENFRRRVRRDGFRLNFLTMTTADVEDFRRYVRDEAALAARYPKVFRATCYPPQLQRKRQRHIEPRGGNTVTKYMGHLSTFFQWLLQTERLKRNPFQGTETGCEHYGTPYYLSVEERNRVADFDLSALPELAVQRDIFVFQCLVGCRVGDLLRFTKKNLADDMLQYVPQKTSRLRRSPLVKVPLGERATRLINRYADCGESLFPFASARIYNAAIRNVLRTCGIDRHVMVRNPKTGQQEMRPICDVASSHMARRTFVAAAYRVVKDPAIVGSMSGHADGSQAFARYRNIEEDVLREVIAHIE